MKFAPTILLALVLLVAGCSTSTPAAEDGRVAVVASTNVWGSVVSAVGGDAVAVTSIIDSPEQDPHEYEADARTQLALSKAQLVVRNGGGYDDFVATMLSSSDARPTVVDAVEVSGLPQGSDFNEHVWYDFSTVTKVADRVAADLTTRAPAQAETFEANAATFTASVRQLQQREASIKKAHAGAGVAITEPVPLYLLQAAGLVDKTPAAFSEAIEEGTDVAPAVLNQTLALFSGHRVDLLVYNEQTSGPQTDRVLAAAKSNGIPAVGVTETLPAGQNYLTWMGANLDAVAAGLSSS